MHTKIRMKQKSFVENHEVLLGMLSDKTPTSYMDIYHLLKISLYSTEFLIRSIRIG